MAHLTHTHLTCLLYHPQKRAQLSVKPLHHVASFGGLSAPGVVWSFVAFKTLRLVACVFVGRFVVRD